MLFHGGVPKRFWVEGFATAISLINFLPSTTINLQSPFYVLYNHFPNYASFCVFESKCHPYTWDTKHNKFDPKTLLCIFMGYSDNHQGYKCYHPPSH